MTSEEKQPRNLFEGARTMKDATSDFSGLKNEGKEEIDVYAIKAERAE